MLRRILLSNCDVLEQSEICYTLQASQAANAQKRQRKSVLADEPAEEPKASSKTIFDDWDDCDVTV